MAKRKKQRLKNLPKPDETPQERKAREQREEDMDCMLREDTRRCNGDFGRVMPAFSPGD